jgi:hypothetical protein
MEYINVMHKYESDQLSSQNRKKIFQEHTLFKSEILLILVSMVLFFVFLFLKMF